MQVRYTEFALDYMKIKSASDTKLSRSIMIISMISMRRGDEMRRKVRRFGLQAANNYEITSL